MIVNRESYQYYCSRDRFANADFKNHSAFESIKKLLFPNPIISFLKLLRKTEYVKNCSRGLKGKILYLYFFRRFLKQSLKLGFSIPLNVCGPGLSLPHYGTIVVNQNAKIGANCRLHVCVNIGASGGSELAPQIGDNVYIGPGSILFGNIVIADNITIAANATVYHTFEIPNITIGGTPAVMLKENTTNWLVKNRINL